MFISVKGFLGFIRGSKGPWNPCCSRWREGKSGTFNFGMKKLVKLVMQKFPLWSFPYVLLSGSDTTCPWRHGRRKGEGLSRHCQNCIDFKPWNRLPGWEGKTNRCILYLSTSSLECYFKNEKIKSLWLSIFGFSFCFCLFLSLMFHLLFIGVWGGAAFG